MLQTSNPASSPSLPTALPLDTDFRISKGLRWSLGIHLGLAVIFFLKNVFFPSFSQPYVPSLKVDVVDLPDLLKKEIPWVSPPPAAEDAAPTKEKEKPLPKTDEMVIQEKHVDKKKRKEKISNALARIRALEKIKAQNQEETVEAPEKIAGNKLSAGSSLGEEAKESAEASYYDKVLDQVKKNWELPVWLARQQLSAQVLVFINASGRIEGQRFVKSSGHPQFDQIVLDTLQKSQPFPHPSVEDLDRLRNGILLGFPL